MDGGRVFDGDSELYIFNKAVGVTPSALIKDIDTLTEELNGLSVEIHTVCILLERPMVQMPCVFVR